jgi:serine/threonine protein kinase
VKILNRFQETYVMMRLSFGIVPKKGIQSMAIFLDPPGEKSKLSPLSYIAEVAIRHVQGANSADDKDSLGSGAIASTRIDGDVVIKNWHNGSQELSDQLAKIERLLESRSLTKLALLGSRVAIIRRIIDHKPLVLGFVDVLRQELDPKKEAANLKRFAELEILQELGVGVPTPISATETSLRMTRLKGEQLAEFTGQLSADSRLPDMRVGNEPKFSLSAALKILLNTGENDSVRLASESKVPNGELPLNGGQAVELMTQLMQVQLSACFDENLLHADPHPGNILISINGEEIQLNIVDFGHLQDLTADQSQALEGLLISLTPFGAEGREDKIRIAMKQFKIFKSNEAPHKLLAYIDDSLDQLTKGEKSFRSFIVGTVKEIFKSGGTLTPEFIFSMRMLLCSYDSCKSIYKLGNKDHKAFDSSFLSTLGVALIPRILNAASTKPSKPSSTPSL